MSSSYLTTIRDDCPILPLPRRLRRWLPGMLRELAPSVQESTQATAADRYRKHFHAATHLQMLLLHGLLGGSLRTSYGVMAGCPEVLGYAPDAPLPVSWSQFAGSSTSRPPAFFAGILPFLLQRARQDAPRADLPATLCVLDATFFPLSVRQAPWLAHHRGPHMQVLYHPASEIPVWVDLAPDVRSNDTQGLDRALLSRPDRLAPLAGQTLVMDLGYYSHARFAALLDADIHLVTRYGLRARYEVLEDRPVQRSLLATQGRITVLHDQRILLGSPNNRNTRRLLELRLVTAQVEPTRKARRRGKRMQEYRLLTDRFDLDAAAVVQLYLWRWEIELFFRWLKRTVGAIRLLGHSQQAVETSIYLAIIVHLIALCAARALGCRRRSTLVRWLLAVLLILLASDPAHAPLLAIACPDG